MDTTAQSLIKYKNGNYIVTLNPETGTKEFLTFRAFEDYTPDFPDSLDIKITGKCRGGCPFCFENSGPEGSHGDLEKLFRILDKLPNVPIEVAIGGGNVLEVVEDNFAGFVVFLRNLKSKGFISGITVRLVDFLEFLSKPGNKARIKTLFPGKDPLIRNIGLSIPTEKELTNIEDDWIKIFSLIYTLGGSIKNPLVDFSPIVVFHTILGITPPELIEKISNKWNNYLREEFGFFSYEINKHFLPRILLLGYKSWGRGENIVPDQKKVEGMKKMMIKVINRSLFPTTPISFDNSAIEQLELKSSLTESRWEKVFMGEETSHSMYIDAVKKVFAPTSHSLPTIPWEVMNNNILEYFAKNKQPHDRYNNTMSFRIND